MKSTRLVAALLCVSAVLLPGGAFAQSGANASGLSISAIAQSLDYAETASGSTLDKDIGTLWGVSARWRQDFRNSFLICDLSYASTKSATYDGALQYSDGSTIPYSFDGQHESILLLQADFGYCVFRSGAFSINTCAGFGYREWLRGEDDSSHYDYKEDYHWFFTDGGLDLDLRTGNWYIGLMGKIAIPLSPVMETSMNGALPLNTSFSLGSVPAFIVKGSIQFYFPSAGKPGRLFLALCPFYEHWGIGKSNPIYITSTQYIYEPDSKTDIYGLTLGLGMFLGRP